MDRVGHTRHTVSQENVEIIRRATEAFNSDGLDGLAEFWHPEIDWRAIEGAPDDIGVFSGRDAMRRYYGEWLGMFDEVRNEADEIIDAGDQVVVAHHASGKQKRTGIPVDMHYAVVYTMESGKMRRGREYATRSEALTAVGITE
jgi:ketosteroid isomerase-like protein